MTAAGQTGEFFDEPISSYSRVQAIADGALIDVSDAARKAGFAVPVAMTCAAYTDCVTWKSEDSQRQTYQEEDARLMDVLRMCQLLARGAFADTDRFVFALNRVPRGGTAIESRPKQLKVIIGPGDTAAPVITIMEVDED